MVKKVRLISKLNNEELKKYQLSGEDLAYRYLIHVTSDINDDHDSDTSKDMVLLCDYVVCCNGIHHTPYIPRIDNKEVFEGELLHTSDYTDMDSLRKRLTGKIIVVVGSNLSGKDIVKHSLYGFKGKSPIDIKSITLVLSSGIHYQAYLKAEDSTISILTN